MRALLLLRVLRSTAAVGAVALGSATAHAACTTTNGVVTCTDASTTNDANSAISRTPPPSVTVVVAAGATVNGGFNSQIVVDSPFRGAIGYTNDGVVGTPERPTDFVTFGDIGSAGNSFTLINRGTQNGGILALGMGGAMTGINSGLVTRGITLSGAGPITFTNTGTVFLSNSPGLSGVIRLESSRMIFTTAADGTQRFTDAGGLVTATIAGRVGRPAASGVPGTAEGVSARGVGGADVTVTGQMGVLDVNAGGYTSDRLFSSTFTGGVSSFTDVSSRRPILSDGRVTLGETGSVTSLFLGATGNATAIVNGTVAGGFNGVSVSSGASASNSRQVSMSGIGSTPSSQASSNAFTNSGGAALVDIGATGRVLGNVSAGSNGGVATVRVAGAIGDTRSAASVDARSVSGNSSSQFNSVNLSDGSAQSSSSSSSTISSGAAIVTVATTGSVAGNISAEGDGSSTVTNAGRVGGIFSNSGRMVTTSSASDQIRTVTNGAEGSRITDSPSSFSRVDETLGGSAQVSNAASGIIGGGVQAIGVGGATLDNVGTIAGSISLRSSGDRVVNTNTNRTTTTIVPATGGGITATAVGESTGTSSARAIGGSVMGTYGGAVGSAPSPNVTNFTTVQQNGTTASTAVVTGTLFADFSGNAGGENRDNSSTSNNRQVTQPNGASSREQSNTFRNTVAQNASTSTLTVAASGRIADNGEGTGNVTLTSAGGDARFVLDGGQVAGDVSTEAGTGVNSVQSNASSATFTRAAAASGVFPPEVQQTQTSSSTVESRQAPGTAYVAVNSGTIGGDLFASGNGSGPGSLGANVVMNGVVTGGLTALSSGVNDRTVSESSITRTEPSAVTGTFTSSSSSAPSGNAGGVLVAVGGTVGGGLVAGTDTANATVDLTGSVGSLSPEGATVLSFGFTSLQQNTTTSAGANFFNLPRTSSVTTASSTLSGGAATLTVAANSGLRAGGGPSIEGDIFVQGFGGSTLNVAAGSRIVQNTGTVDVGAAFTNTASTTTFSYANIGPLNGVQTGSVVNSTATRTGGPAVLTNAGVIGSLTNAPVVTVGSVGGASVTNSGTINGSILATARGANRVTTSTVTNVNDFANRRTVATNRLTAVGGAVQVNNSALVTGDVTAVGATGTVTNAGVIRGAVTLGGSFSNFTTTATTTNVTTGSGAITPVTVNAPSIANATPFTQSYTLNQNGLLLRGVTVTGATTVDPSGATVRTSNVNATVNLNNGSITLGNVTADRATATNLNLNGAGLLGVAAGDSTGPAALGAIVAAYTPTPALARFTAIDPTLGAAVPLPSGSRVSGVQTLTKAGDGTFVIVGAPLLAGVGMAAPTYTLDVGTLRNNGGELQLGLAGATPSANSFGIRGTVDNNASLVVGRRITNGAQTAIQGINVSVLGNVTNGQAGSLIVGVNPAFVRANIPAAGASPFAGAPAPFVAFGPTSGLSSTNSFVRVDGNLTLAGTVQVQTSPGGLYEAGRAYDLFSVSGTYANTGTLRSTTGSPFVGFTLTPRTEGGRTVVSLGVVRTNFDTVATDRNAAVAAGALQAELPSVFAGIRSGTSSGNAQDLANIVAALDTQLSTDQAAQVFRELSSGEVYGSLSAISTTAPFGDATDGLSPAGTGSGPGLWFRPTGQFANYLANDASGASEIGLSNYGGSLGLNYASGNGGHVGLAGGYGRLKVRAQTPERADADTYMAGVYAVQQLGRLHFSGQAVYGWSNWNASRTLTLLNRRATSRFDSNELRANLRVAYTIAMLPDFDLSPFAKVEVRRYRFDGFTEQGAGAASLAVGARRKSVVSPELGVRMSGALGSKVRPFAEASYIFQEDVGSDRRMAFVGGTQGFTLEGVDPGDAIKGAVGVAADVGAGTLFLRGDYYSGGSQQVGSVRGGLLFTF